MKNKREPKIVEVVYVSLNDEGEERYVALNRSQRRTLEVEINRGFSVYKILSENGTHMNRRAILAPCTKQLAEFYEPPILVGDVICQVQDEHVDRIYVRATCSIDHRGKISLVQPKKHMKALPYQVIKHHQERVILHKN